MCRTDSVFIGTAEVFLGPQSAEMEEEEEEEEEEEDLLTAHNK